jgi:predicted alpha-1,6-mannanase (GH76 family)
MKNIRITPLALGALLALGLQAHAQTIERVKMTDNDLSCQQIFTEIGQMDAAIANANQPAAPTAGNVAAAVGTEVAGQVAQQALARTGFGGLFGGGGGGGGGFGGLFGGMAQQAAANVAQNQAQQQAAAQQAAAAQSAQTVQQATGRKEHLTGLFLGKGCKMSDMQK